MFKFGFSVEENETNEVTEEVQDNVKWLESRQVMPDEVNCDEIPTTNILQCGQVSIKYICDKALINEIKSNDSNSVSNVLNAEERHSDLITGLYEGGLKIWECTYDLLEYLLDQKIDFMDKSVLDLGCGAGIIGIFTSLNGSKTVFQDYNLEVIKLSTIPNVKLNNVKMSQCSFFNGDWESFLNLTKNKNKFDYILTSETIYNVNNYNKILKIFQQLLKENGIIYLAAKCHYFGVGGSLGEFEEYLQKSNSLNYERCWTSTQGMKRAINKIILK